MDRRRTLYPLLSLTALTVVAYANSLHASFQFDDATSIVDNRAVHVLDPAGWWAFWPGRILTYASFALNYAAGGLRVDGYHLVNLLVHLSAGLGLYFLVRELRPPAASSRSRQWIAWATAAIFLTHPLATQAVTYIVQRATSLCYAFYFWAVVLHLKALRRKTEGGSAPGLRAASIACAVAAALSKEVAVSLPFALVLASAVAFPGQRGFWRSALPTAAVTWGLQLLAVVVGGSHFGVAGGALTAETERISRGSYLLTQIHSVARYLRLGVLPVGQTVDADIPWRHWPAGPSTWGLLALHLALWAFAVHSWRRGRRLDAFCVTWFYLLLAPSSSLFPIRDAFFEHRAYGALLAVALGIARLLDLLRRRRPTVAATAAGLLIVSLTTATVQRNRVWSTPLSLWRDAVAKAPHKSRPHMAYGVALGQAGRLDEAIVELDTAVRISPDFARAWNDLGQALLRKGDAARGLPALRRAVQLDPRNVSAWYNLAVAQDRSGDVSSAETSYRKALELDPRFAPALNGLAGVLLRRGNAHEAYRLAQRAASEGGPAPALLRAIRRALRDSAGP